MHGFQPLTARDAAAPDLLQVLGPEPTNPGPASVAAVLPLPTVEEVARVAARPPNDLQKSLGAMAAILPTVDADIGVHIERLKRVPDPAPAHPTADAAVAEARAHVKAFLGR